ncbi:MAG: SdrD B-like domain-containing protein [Candidatus Thermoplasmatota archaeon]
MTPNDGTDSWFDFTIYDVPPGYDITDDIYPGWCVQQLKEMEEGPNHPVKLKSCYADDLQNGFENINWTAINYIINHKQGKNRLSVQRAIWNFTDNLDNTGYPGAQAIVNDTMINGPGYVPQAGEILAVVVEGAEGALQLAFLELIIPDPYDVKGLVWEDTDKDGIQEWTEKGLSGVTVELYLSNDTLSQTTTTDARGVFIFTDITPGEYYLKFTLKSGYNKFTLKGAGSDDTIDSDADTTTGKTIGFTVSENESITEWDAGMYIQTSGGEEPEPPEEEPSNTRPTADATAGEPYRGFINGIVTFNGSKSYDYDGRIISWRWVFGDGTNGTGDVTTHVYTTPGVYNVSLLVMDDDFATDMYTTTATITEENNAPAKPVIAGPLSGVTTVNYLYTVVAIDPDGDNLRYFIDWGDNTQDNSSFLESGTNHEFSHQWTTPGFYTIQTYAQDIFNDTSDTTQIKIAIAVSYVKDYGYLVDNNGDGAYDKFHANATGVETPVNQQSNGAYLIDTDGDGKWNIEYNPGSGETQDYQETPLLQYALIILGILIIVLLILYFVLRNRRKSKTISKNQESKQK